MTITEKIIALRTEKRIKSSEIANALDLHHSNYLRIEKRDKELSINQLESIAKVLGVSLIELLNYGEGVESVKVDSEKVKELEREIKDLKKDLEILVNKNELQLNKLMDIYKTIFENSHYLECVVHDYARDVLAFIFKENGQSKETLIEALNKVSMDMFINYLRIDILKQEEDYMTDIFNLLSEPAQLETLRRVFRRKFILINLSVMTDDNLLKFIRRIVLKDDERIRDFPGDYLPTKIVRTSMLMRTTGYIQNTEITQTGFFRIANLENL
jgi:transcriptional regulator with XRE-family HTH domain